MLKKVSVLAVLMVAVGSGEARAQSLSEIIPNLFGVGGLTVKSDTLLADGSTHSGPLQ